jgi:DNA-binding XRE family transcriptional regulator
MGIAYPQIVEQRKTTFCGLMSRPHMVDAQAMSEAAFPYAAIGQRLEKLRRGMSDLTQREWAEKHGFAPSQYNNWATGARRIPVESAEKLCQIYGLTLDAIYRGRLDGLPENIRNVL